MYDTIRRYHILIKMDVGKSVEWDEKVANVINKLPTQGTLTQSYNQIFEKGVDAYDAEDMTERSDSNKISKKIREFDKEQAEKKNMETLYARMGFDDFVAWCEEEEIDWQTFLDDYDIAKQSTLKWSEKAVLWLKDYMRDKEAKNTTDIRTAAIKCELITNNEKDWSKLRTLSSRNGFTTSDKSWWKLPY